MPSPDDPSAFAWGPDRRMPPVGASSAPGFLVIAIVALLAAGGIGIAVHHKAKATAAPTVTTRPPAGRTTTTRPGATTTTALTPPGSERLLDLTDHLSVAVPLGWQAPTVSGADLATALKSMSAKDPTLKPLLDIALGALSRIQIGVFAVETSTRTTLYAYGVDVPGQTSATQIPSSDVVKQVQGVGGKNVHFTTVQLPVGPAGQITAQLVVNRATISEALDYFVLDGRLVTIVVASRGTTSQLPTLTQIQATVVPA